MEVDPNKIVERLSGQIAQLSLQNAALQAQLETVVEAYNKLVTGEEDVSEAERVAPDEIIQSASVAD